LPGKFIDNQRKILNGYKKVGPYLGLGTQLAATVILMFYLGYWLDKKFDTYPILIIIFSLLGGFAAIYNFIKSVLKLSSKEKQKQ
jgi:F0F1-type ATP synthase assembly protein I